MNDLWHSNHQRIHNQRGIIIDDPQVYSCSVLLYIRGHSEMVIEVVDRRKNTYNPFYLWLPSVWYFEGPTRWQGVDFRLGSFEECRELVNQGWINVDGLIDEFVKEHILLILDRPTFRVRILASRCDIDTIQPRFQILEPEQPTSD